MAAVIELIKDENMTIANTKTHTAKKRSMVFVGVTSIEAGVNWVSDQCSAVAYLYLAMDNRNEHTVFETVSW